MISKHRIFVKGKAAHIPGVEFGEAVLWKKRPTGGSGLGKLAVSWADGIFLGIKGTTGEYIIGTGEGTYRTRTIERKPFQNRWRAEEVRGIVGVPWRTARRSQYSHD